MIKKFIIYCLLFTLNVHDHKKDLCFIVSRNEGRLWATDWQGQMTAYIKHKTFNCDACVNDLIYLFYSIFFMFLPRYVLDKTIFFDKTINLNKTIFLTIIINEKNFVLS